MKFTKIILLCLAPALCSTSAFADGITFDASVNANGPATTVPGNAPGIYYGTGGNANGFWTVDTQSDIELGLRAHVRSQNTFDSNGNGVYGSFTDVANPASHRASWNYDFSINVNADGLGSATLSDYSFLLWVDSDPSAGDSWTSYNPLTLPTDDTPTGSTTIAQNSENPLFPGEGIPNYNGGIAGIYDFVLAAYNSDGVLVDEIGMRVEVNGATASDVLPSVPDHGSTAILSGLAFAGLAVFGLKKSRRQVTS